LTETFDGKILFVILRFLNNFNVEQSIVTIKKNM